MLAIDSVTDFNFSQNQNVDTGIKLLPVTQDLILGGTPDHTVIHEVLFFLCI
jgi:hypothetical protein